MYDTHNNLAFIVYPIVRFLNKSGMTYASILHIRLKLGVRNNAITRCIVCNNNKALISD